jgi:hypothetical protein
MPQPMSRPVEAQLFGSVHGRGLGESELVRASRAILPIVPHWCVELCGSDSTDRALVVMPDDADDLVGPTYIVRYEAGQFQLEQMRFDILEAIAEADQFEEMIGILRGRVGSHALMVMGKTALCH